MGNVFDYIKNEGRRSLRELEFGPVDALILSQLTYLNFDYVFSDYAYTMADKEPRPLPLTVITPFARSRLLFKNIRAEQDCERLYRLFAKSKRFRDTCLSGFVNEIDLVEEKQFSAVIFKLPDETDFVAYRGTDMTVIGWKEDFNLTYKNPIPAQAAGAEYLNKAALSSDRPLRVGGHSKGGNLAVYSASKCLPEVKKRILEVYSLDGPGFRQEFLSDQDYLEVKDKIKKYLPQSSLIGMIMHNQEDYTIIKSNRRGLNQHDLFSWQVENGSFVYVEEIADTSVLFDKTIAEWLARLDDDKRKLFFDTLYGLIKQTNIKTLPELSSEKKKAVKSMLQTAKGIDAETKKFISKAFASFVLLAPKTYKDEIALVKIKEKKTKIEAKLHKNTNN